MNEPSTYSIALIDITGWMWAVKKYLEVPRIGWGFPAKKRSRKGLRIALPVKEVNCPGRMNQNSMSASVSAGATARNAARRLCQSE